jgi:hypothetical protein
MFISVHILEVTATNTIEPMTSMRHAVMTTSAHIMRRLNPSVIP